MHFHTTYPQGLSQDLDLGHPTFQRRKEYTELTTINMYCRTHNVSVCLYIAYIACGSTSLYIKTLYFFLTVLALSAVATVANIKIRYDAKIPQLAIFGTCMMHPIYMCSTVFNYQDKA